MTAAKLYWLHLFNPCVSYLACTLIDIPLKAFITYNACSKLHHLATVHLHQARQCTHCTDIAATAPSRPAPPARCIQCLKMNFNGHLGPDNEDSALPPRAIGPRLSDGCSRFGCGGLGLKSLYRPWNFVLSKGDKINSQYNSADEVGIWCEK